MSINFEFSALIIEKIGNLTKTDYIPLFFGLASVLVSAANMYINSKSINKIKTIVAKDSELKLKIKKLRIKDASRSKYRDQLMLSALNDFELHLKDGSIIYLKAKKKPKINSTQDFIIDDNSNRSSAHLNLFRKTINERSKNLFERATLKNNEKFFYDILKDALEEEKG